MLGVIRWVKYHFSHVSTSSWHYKVVSDMFPKTRWESRKACTYYWGFLPTSLLLVAVLLFLAFALFVICLFCGYVLTIFKTTDQEMMRYQSGTVYPYKHLPNGVKLPVAPWEVAVFAGVIYEVYYLSMVNPELGLDVGVWLLGILSLVLLVIVAATIWMSQLGQRIRSALGSTWQRVCPPLVIVERENS